MTFLALRGGTPLADEIELKAHLASLLRLENVGVLLGAGASVGAGGRVMNALWNDFLANSDFAAKWLLEQQLVETKNVNPMPMPDPQPPKPPEAPNVELLADALEIAILEWERQGSTLAADAKVMRAELFRAVLRAATLNEANWISLGGTDVAADRLGDHRSILQKMTSARQPGQAPPWVFTTNYDLAIEWAAESVDIQVLNGFLGVHTRRFSPQSFDLGFRNIQARGEARFGVYNVYLAKLHGSMTWKEVEGQLFEFPAGQAWQELKRFLGGETDDLNYLVLPRAAKYLQTVGYTLGELLRRFSEFMARPQTALIVAGYGFGDEHINRLIRSALLNPTLQIVVYQPEFNGDPASTSLAPTMRRLLALQNPRLTIVGGGSEAFFSKLAQHLPDPAVYNEDLRELERRLRPLKPDEPDKAP